MTTDDKIRIAKYWGYTISIEPDNMVLCTRDDTHGTSHWLGNSAELNVNDAFNQVNSRMWKEMNRHIAGGFGRGWT